MQAQALITECVPKASDDPDLRTGLESLAACMKWTFQDTLLKLETQWPTHRHRWWTISFPVEWTAEPFQAWIPSQDFAVIDRVLPHWGTFPENEEHDLLLDAHELTTYLNPAYGSESRMLFPSKMCPTVLHSYGNVFRDCPCGCRGPIAETSLVNKGLRGVLVHSDRYGQPRYLHPVELAALLTVPLTMKFLHPPRDALCLLGQVAAPLQSLWAYQHLLKSAASYVPGLCALDTAQVVEKFKAVLLQQIHDQFPFATPCRTLSLQLFHRDGPPVQLFSCWGNTTAKLAKAEAISLDWGHKISFTKVDGTPVAVNQTLLSDGEALYIERNAKRQCLERPEGKLMVGIQRGHGAQVECMTSFVSPGDFLFQAFWEHDLDTRTLLTDGTGKIFAADCKIWSSTMFYCLESVRFPTINGTFGHQPIQALVPTDSQAGGAQVGLDNCAAWAAMRDLQDNIPCCLLEPIKLDSHWIGFDSAPVFHGLPACSDSLFIAFQANGHWGLLHGLLEGDQMNWTYFDGVPHLLHRHAARLATAVTRLLGLASGKWRLAGIIRQTDQYSCGTVAICHMALVLGLAGQFTPRLVEQLHLLFSCRNHKASWISGLGPHLPAQLAALLATKGVPTSAAADRAQAAIQKLGTSSVEQALRDSNPWQALKGLTSKPGNGF